MDTPSGKRNVRGIFVALKLRLTPAKVKAFEPCPETVAIHARLETLEGRLDQALHNLKRRLSSKAERPHLTAVPRAK